MRIGEPKRINEVVLLVHPLFSIFDHRESENDINVRKNAKIMLGLWGKKIKLASKNTSSILIILPPATSAELKWARDDRWVGRKFERLAEFARRKFGKRLVKWEPSNRPFQETLRRKGFVIDREALKGESFGQYFQHCVRIERDALAEVFGVPTKSIPQLRELSLKGDFRYAKREFRELRKDRRKTARRIGAARRV